MKRLAIFATMVVLATGLAACGHGYAACASPLDPVVYAKPSGGGSSGGSSSGSHSSSGSSGSHSSGSPSKAPSSQNSPSKAPSAPSKAPTAQNSPSKAPAQSPSKAPSAQNNAKVTPPGEKAYTPPRSDVKPPAKQVSQAQKSAPQKLTTSGHYTSPVTHHVYVYHDSGYYSSPGYVLDLFDPYNPANYTLNVYSPFYGRPYNIVAHC